MRASSQEKVWRGLPWVALAALVVYLVSPTLRSEGPQDKAGSDREKGPVPSSYDQVSPVLLGQETFQQMLAKDKADKNTGSSE